MAKARARRSTLPARDPEHRGAGSRLDDQERSFHELVERAPFGIYVVDQALRIVTMNAGTQTSTFANVRPVIGCDLAVAMRVLWSEEVAAEIVENFRHTLESGEPYRSNEFSNPRVDRGVRESYEWELHRIRLPNLSYGVACYFFDSTTLRNTEQELRRSQQRLQDDDRRKNEFLATLGHELRNPLSAIGGAASLLQRTSVPADKKEHFAKVIQRQTAAMAVLLDDLLEMSRIATGKLQLRKKPVSVASLVESALEPIHPMLAGKEHSLRLEVDDGETLLDVDPVRTAQVLTNLLTNSIKYSDRGGSIVLRTLRDPLNVTFEVHDTGIGLSTEQLPTIFEMFAQVAPNIERSEGGLGIGLAVAKAIVELHDGRIEASSPGLGQGSVFTVVIPRGNVAAPATASTETPIESDNAKQGPILVADDNIDAAETLAAALELDGYKVHIALDGVEALELAKKVRPVACFLDIGMPRMNGYDLASELRQLEGGGTMLLVAITGWGQAQDKRRAQDAGFDAHMTKPVALGEVAKVLAQRKTA